MRQARAAIDTERDVIREGDGRIVTMDSACHEVESNWVEIVLKVNRSIYQPMHLTQLGEEEGTTATHLDNFDINFGAHFPNVYTTCLRSRGVSA